MRHLHSDVVRWLLLCAVCLVAAPNGHVVTKGANTLSPHEHAPVDVVLSTGPTANENECRVVDCEASTSGGRPLHVPFLCFWGILALVRSGCQPSELEGFPPLIARWGQAPSDYSRWNTSTWAYSLPPDADDTALLSVVMRVAASGRIDFRGGSKALAHATPHVDDTSGRALSELAVGHTDLAEIALHDWPRAPSGLLHTFRCEGCNGALLPVKSLSPDIDARTVTANALLALGPTGSRAGDLLLSLNESLATRAQQLSSYVEPDAALLYALVRASDAWPRWLAMAEVRRRFASIASPPRSLWGRLLYACAMGCDAQAVAATRKAARAVADGKGGAVDGFAQPQLRIGFASIPIEWRSEFLWRAAAYEALAATRGCANVV